MDAHAQEQSLSDTIKEKIRKTPRERAISEDEIKAQGKSWSLARLSPAPRTKRKCYWNEVQRIYRQRFDSFTCKL
jgi:hypothetical protein